MTPPKAPEIRLRFSPLSEDQEPFVFAKPQWLVTDPLVSSFIPNGGLSIGGTYLPSSTLTFPKLFGPKPSWASNPPAPVPPRPWKPSDTGQLILDILMAIDSMDVDLNDLTVNGGQKGCRYSEVVRKDRYDAGKEKCKNQFEAGTLADVHLEVRPVEGKTYSELNRFGPSTRNSPDVWAAASTAFT